MNYQQPHSGSKGSLPPGVVIPLPFYGGGIGERTDAGHEAILVTTNRSLYESRGQDGILTYLQGAHGKVPVHISTDLNFRGDSGLTLVDLTSFALDTPELGAIVQ